MALHVLNVPNPAAGRDWVTTVPGQYLYRVTGITATLNTLVPVSSVADASGNGRNLTALTLGTAMTFGADGPYTGGAADYAVQGHRSGATGSPAFSSPSSAQFGTVPFSVDGWVNLNAVDVGSSDSLIAFGQSGFSTLWWLGIKSDGASPATLDGVFSGFFFNLAVGVLPRSGWHHVAATADGVNWRAYVDGALVGTVAGHQPTPSSPFVNVACDGVAFNGSVAGIAVYPSLLSGAQIAAHAAANATNAAYRAAVLSDAPAGFWLFDGVPNSTSRVVSLEITNGTATVGSYPAPFPAQTVLGAINYSWQPTMPSSTQTPNGTTTAVAIPPLILPAGYTIGSRTADIAATDQWSNVVVWWDDDIQQAVQPYSPYTFPPGARLVYRQETPQ